MMARKNNSSQLSNEFVVAVLIQMNTITKNLLLALKTILLISIKSADKFCISLVTRLNNFESVIMW